MSLICYVLESILKAKEAVTMGNNENLAKAKMTLAQKQL